MRQYFFSLLLFLSVYSLTLSASPPLIYPQPAQANDSDYPQVLLAKALQTAGLDYHLRPSADSIVQSRALRQLKANDGIDVVWTMTSVEREKQLLPVRIPIFKGLYGWRLLMIKASSQSKLDHIDSVSALAAIPLLQGQGWPDTYVLQANGLRVSGTPQTHDLFEMLLRDRGIAFPRSILEIWTEQENYQSDLVVEKQLALFYPTAIYFFFRPTDTVLAAGIKSGLKQMLANGEFDRLFTAYHQQAIDKARLFERKVLPLWNPLLPQLTPLEQERYWYRP
ncbi:transporter substrate-binding domain-containing protein [Bowmanella yangjiangensis]|uniref:Transporter substrate-binding domain-containing protein n=1 Tax=Bowmanella yangjiangensis TaxID=2811230 RepID=A0ABS3CU97_9ALTE|nr:transporter substrate-binding domain-containing protein [Bowmanella yangjiangensis]MBN7820697.1 transporter substrate-binding domain-containing protein [Bowmanella yangjiangensis]